MLVSNPSYDYSNIYNYAVPLKKAYNAGMHIAHHTWSHSVNINGQGPWIII